MTVIAPQYSLPRTAGDLADEWIAELNEAARTRDLGRVAALFAADATWRDFLAYSWNFSNHFGAPAVAAALASHDLGTVRLHAGQAPALEDVGDGVQHLVAFLQVDGANGPCSGVVRLALVGSSWVALGLMTQLESVAGHPLRSGADRQTGKAHAFVPDRPRWQAERANVAAFEDSEPSVVVIGGAQCGLAVAARLGELDVPTLVIEKLPRVGDVWRNRYASLALHDPINMDHMPYLPFPSTWPAHTPKDKFADFLEQYVDILDLNVWTGTTVEEVSHDGGTIWTVRVRRADGSVRDLRPRHVVMATGLNGEPNVPDVEGAADFDGEIIHSGAFAGGEGWAGKRATVVGAGVSGHEIALDLVEHGADVTIVQRSSTYVVNAATFGKFLLTPYLEGGRPVAFADMVANAAPNAVSAEAQKALTALSAEEDRPLLDALEARGFQLNYGPEGRGVVGAHITGRDGYHINIGAAELVADGRIGLKQGVEVVRLRPGHVDFSDGTSAETDLLVWATGYHPMIDTIRTVLGPAADRVGQVYGLAADGEYSETWRRSGQPGLWFATGFISVARYYSKLLALQIKAIETGAMPYEHP